MFHAFYRHTQSLVILVNTVSLTARLVWTVQQAWSARQLHRHPQCNAFQVSSQVPCYLLPQVRLFS